MKARMPSSHTWYHLKRRPSLIAPGIAFLLAFLSGNSFDHRQWIETYVAVDLVAYVDHRYRTLADVAHRAIGGLSMGGFGAMNIAVHHPDVFGTVISLGGYYRAEGSIWGKNAAYRRANSPI